MRVGIVHLALGAETLTDVFSRAAEAGADGVEVRYASAGIATALRQAEHAGELKQAAEGASMAIASLRLDCLCAQPSLIGRPEVIESGQELVLRALGCATEAGAEMITVPFFGKNAIEIEEELNHASEALLELVDHAEEAGVILAVESTLAFHQDEFLLSYLGNTGDVKISCNTGVALSRKLDLPTGIRQLSASAIAQVRFKDVRINEGAPPDFDVPLGEGNVDFGATAQALRAVGYDGWVIVEPPAGPDAETVPAARAAVDFARTVLRNAGGS